MHKAYESEQIQSKIQKLKDNINRLAEEEKQIQDEILSNEEQEDDEEVLSENNLCLENKKCRR